MHECIRLLAAVLLIFHAGGGTSAAETLRFTYGGETRTVILERPRRGTRLPAIVLLHGGAGAPRQIIRHAALDAVSRGWVLVVPEGLSRHWNDGRTDRAGQPLSRRDDAGFLAALLESLGDRGLIDRRNIFMTGISNGGFMTLRMLCDYPGLVAGAAVLKAGHPVGLACRRRAPTPLLFFHGTDDPLVPFGGGPVGLSGRDRGRTASSDRTVGDWAAANRCHGSTKTSLPDRVPADGTRVLLIRYRNCAAPLRHYVIEGGGHGWPGRPAKARWARRILGPITRDIDAGDIMLGFFRANLR
ncbi:MAG: alpha/beta hydrolase family esterase [Paracoccaceae bacterium]